MAVMGLLAVNLGITTVSTFLQMEQVRVFVPVDVVVAALVTFHAP